MPLRSGEGGFFNMRNFTLVSWGIKSVIVLFWVLFFIGILYVPLKFNFFSERTLNVATWTDLIDPRILEKFYKKTGIKVYLSYFEDNYELVQKLKSTDGQGYDLVIPSDFAVQKLIDYNLLKPLDIRKFAHWERINPALKNTYADEGNMYSIPYYWAIYGLGIDSEFFPENVESSWRLIFEQLSSFSKVGVIGSARETVLMAAQYLFGTIDSLTCQQLYQLRSLLIKQKEWVEAYTEFRADSLLLSKTSPVVVITTPQILRLLKICAQVRFLMPVEGAFQVIDSWVIPKQSTKEALVYELLNFLYQEEIMAHHFHKYTFFPATIDLFKLLDKSVAGRSLLAVHAQKKIPVDFFRNVIDEQVLNTMWVEIKSS